MQSPVFEGHFPGYPLMPGVLLIENMAQTCGWLVSAITGFTGLPVLAGVKEAKVRGAVFPGMEISTEGKIVHDGSGFAIADGKISVRRYSDRRCAAGLSLDPLSEPGIPEHHGHLGEAARLPAREIPQSRSQRMSICL